LRTRGVLDLRLVPVELVEPRLEDLTVLLEIGLDRPVFLWHELADPLLALDDQPQRHRLHAARRETRLEALPEERRRLVADQAVEDAPRLLGIHLFLIDVHGVRERLGDRFLGDLVEQHPAHLAAIPQLLGYVPRDRLALAVGVRGDEHPVGGLRGLLDLGEGLRLALDRHVLRGEALVDIHAELALRQITDVPHRRLARVAAATSGAVLRSVSIFSCAWRYAASRSLSSWRIRSTGSSPINNGRVPCGSARCAAVSARARR